MVAGFAVTAAGVAIAGTGGIPWSAIVVSSLLGSFNAPVTALFLASLAENKVSGFAMVKVLNSFNMLPVVAYFLPDGWQFISAGIPSYWAMKVVWLGAAGEDYLLYVIAGVVVGCIVLGLLLHRFARVVHRQTG
jgi:fluoroquinolone transport system permease protein